MTRPQIIRADTIDLQDRLSPSAQDHSRQPTHPSALGAGPPAPHQAETLREIAAEAEEEQRRSPRVSEERPSTDFDHTLQYSNDVASTGTSNPSTSKGHQEQDALAISQNGGLAGGEDADMADAEGDDSLDDDMMDKISSSPSIDDGGYSLSNDRLSDFDYSVVTLRPPIISGVVDGSSSSACPEESGFYLSYSGKQIEPSPCSGPRIKGLGPKDGPSNTIYGDWSCETPPLVVNSVFDEFLESYDDDFELSFSDDMFAVQTEVDLQSGFEDSYEGVMTIPYESSEEEDIIYPNDPRFIDSGWGGECLQESEDIDFEFVYALHTFVANVEGQANATKGDTMVLLDDSNSYWWLVRVVKDSSIGYLPAEHIETPTERLARLNKHRNIDLSAAMLGDKDMGEKSKNPLKKAIRRRGAKTVTFSAPTYVEASDIDYSTDSEVEGDYGQEQQQQSQNVSQPEAEEDKIEVSLSVAAKAEAKEPTLSVVENNDHSNELTSKPITEVTKSSDEAPDNKSDSIVKSRNGTVRNTDSFFQDDSVETRKITLTPNLLRDDSSTSMRTSNDLKEVKQRTSFEKSEKDPFSDKGNDRKRKKEKEKDKKPGVLSGFFKRGSRKSKPQEEESEELVYGKKSSEEARISPAPSKDSVDLVVEEQTQSSPQREPTKLQKPRSEGSVSSQLSETRPTDSQQLHVSESAPIASATVLSMRLVESESKQFGGSLQNTRGVSAEHSRDGISSDEQQEGQKPSGTLSKILWKGNSSSESRPAKVKKAKIRAELDDFDSADDRPPPEGGRREPTSKTLGRFPAADTYSNHNVRKSANEVDDTKNERLSESPVQISNIEISRVHPPPLMTDTSSQDEVLSLSPSPSPELMNADNYQEKKSPENIISTPTSTSTWSDSHLRTFFDDESDVKDLLVVVYDKSGVVPAGPEHPIIGNMFKEESAKLADITNRLDSILGDWLARKMRILEGRA